MAAPPLLVAAWSVLALFKPEGELGAELELRGGSAPSATGQGAALQLRSTATPYAEARLRSRRLTSQLRYAPRFTWQLPAVGAAWDPIVYHHVLFGHAYRVSRRLDHTVSVAVSGGELDYVGAVDELGELGEALPSVDDAARLDLALATGLRFAFSRRQTLSTDLDARYGGPSGRQAFVSALGGDTADDVTLVAAFSTSASVGYEVALGRASSLSALGTVGWHSFSTGSRLLFAPASVGVTRRWGERTRTSALLGAGYLRVWTPLATEATEATEATDGASPFGTLGIDVIVARRLDVEVTTRASGGYILSVDPLRGAAVTRVIGSWGLGAELGRSWNVDAATNFSTLVGAPSTATDQPDTAAIGNTAMFGARVSARYRISSRMRLSFGGQVDLRAGPDRTDSTGEPEERFDRLIWLFVRVHALLWASRPTRTGAIR